MHAAIEDIVQVSLNIAVHRWIFQVNLTQSHDTADTICIAKESRIDQETVPKDNTFDFCIVQMGELQIALQDMKNSGRTNVVGHIREEELFILDSLKPWQKFKFTL